MFRLSVVLSLLALLALGNTSVGSSAESGLRQAHDCDAGGPLCAEVLDSIGYNGRYTGHDEPALLFYSNVPGSGNHMTYLMRLPKDPLTLPTQDGKGGRCGRSGLRLCGRCRTPVVCAAGRRHTGRAGPDLGLQSGHARVSR